ncbi:MAG: LamG-like jellyroll fold domain-containing protein, partial [Candidatus Thorarchaeota archaeon]
MDQISTTFTPIKNGLLDNYHSERTIIPGSPWSGTEYDVPDNWNIIEEGESPNHPYYSRLSFHSYSGLGRQGSMGWRFNAYYGTTNAIDPSMKLYLSQQVHIPYRELYSARISLEYYVRSQSTLNDYFYLFVRMGDYEAKLHLFESGDATDQWIPYSVDVPMSAFSSYPIPGAMQVDIGIGTDYSGLPSATVDHQLHLDEVDMVLQARPLPEQIGLSANHTTITGSSSGNVSPYVPDGALRDCFSRSDTGIDTSYALEVGAWSSSGSSWNDVVEYQIGLQFPLNIPQGAIITSAILDVEALGYFGGGDNGLRVFVAEEDDVSPFTDGLPILEDRYRWSNTSVSWIQNSWDNGQRYKTSDMSSLIQSVVSRSGWSDGNYICLMIDYMNSNQYRDWNSIKGTWSYNGADLAKLYVDFVVPQEEDTISVLSYKKDIIIDHTKVDDDITNFPLLIDIYDADLKTKAQYDGDDIIFKSGGLQLSHEIELYEPDSNSTHAHLVAWVKTDLSSTVDTTITMLYGDSEITSNENPEAVWTSGFAGVWHLSQDQSGTGNVDLYQDSSSSNNDGNDYVSATGKDGRADGGQQFDGNNDYVDLDSHVGDYASLSEGSISLWFRYSDTSDYKLLFSASCNTDDNSDLNIMYYQPDDEFMVGIREDGGSVWIANFPGSYADGSWHHYTLTVDGSGNNHYIDGNPITCTYPYGGSASTQGFFNNVTGLNTLRFGNREDFTGHQYHFAGSIDEVRISSVARTAGWVSTSFNNQDDPAGFLRVGTEQSVQFGQNATLLFTTDVQSVVSILPRMTLTATTQETTLDANMQQGTSFYAINGTSVTWTANVLIDPPTNLANTSLILEKQSTWTLQSITDSIGNIRTSEATTTATQVMVPSSVIDVTGMWIFNFTSTNEASDLECAAGGSPYGMTAIAQTGQLIDFIGTASIIPGSAMRLALVDPYGQVFYASDDLSQDGSGQFEWTGIAVDSSWDCGTWKAHVDFNDTAGASPLYVGRYSREFVVQHVSSLNLQAPGDAVGDQLSVRVAGDLLLVEVHLTDTDTTESIAGSSVTMNWTVSGAPTQVQLEDYGDGTYVKALNTSDLGLPGMWRINIQSSHPYLVDSSTYFDLELSHPTYIYYETPEPTAYTDDFAVKITLYDAINGDPYPSATIASNGTMVGVPTDYGNGTYLVQIDSSGLELGSYGFQIDGSPSQSFVLGSSVNVVFAYRTISTELVQLGASPINVPWGRTVNTTLEWQDFDHGGVGIAGGTLVGDATFQHTDLLDGTYSIEIDVSDYAIGTYLFNFSISRAYYDMGQITVAVNVVPHRTSLIATYNSSVPVGTNTYISLAYYDLDSGSTAVPGNFSSVQAQWSGGSSPFGSMDFWLQTEGWALGSHTLNLTLFATTSPRFYFDANTAVIIEIRKVTTELSWTPIYSFPVGDDFAITLFLNVSEPVSKYDGDSIDGLDVSYFDAEDKDGTPYAIKDLSFLGNGEYLLTIDQAFFPANSYTVRIFVTFGALENFTSTQTPIINFDYSEARSELTSP